MTRRFITATCCAKTAFPPDIFPWRCCSRFFRCWIGGPAAAATLEELIAKGGRKFLYFGSCGAISNLAAGHLIVPTEAYRDEGVSYHYLPADDYAPLPGSSALTHIFDELALPYAAGRVWTTDSFYRETRGNMAKRQQDGCLAVDMECASLSAAAAFRGVEFCQFLYAADSLTGEAWDKRILGGMTQDARSRVLFIALEAAIRL